MVSCMCVVASAAAAARIPSGSIRHPPSCTLIHHPTHRLEVEPAQVGPRWKATELEETIWGYKSLFGSSALLHPSSNPLDTSGVKATQELAPLLKSRAEHAVCSKRTHLPHYSSWYATITDHSCSLPDGVPFWLAHGLPLSHLLLYHWSKEHVTWRCDRAMQSLATS